LEQRELGQNGQDADLLRSSHNQAPAMSVRRGIDRISVSHAMNRMSSPVSDSPVSDGHKSELAEADDIIGWSPRNSSDTNTLGQVFKLSPKPPSGILTPILRSQKYNSELSASGQFSWPAAASSRKNEVRFSSCIVRGRGVFVEPRGTPGRPRSTSGVYSISAPCCENWRARV